MKSINEYTKTYGERPWPGHPDQIDRKSAPNAWIPKQALNCAPIRINTHPKLSDKYKEIDTKKEYRDFVCKRQDDYIISVKKQRDHMSSTTEYANNVWELAHAPEHVRR